MTNIPANQIIQNAQTGTPLYTYGNNLPPKQQTVTVTSPNKTSQIYQYPQTSVYNDPNKQAASGVNIYIYNPSAIGAPNSTSTANATYQLPNGTQPIQQNNIQSPMPYQVTNPEQNAAIANTPISNQTTENANNGGKTKQVVELNDDYIKSLESYIRSQDSHVRQTGITELIKRFEEDNTRYNDPALIALLNIALQDPVPNNRVLAMSVIAGGSATGDANTIKILEELQKSDKLFGQEAIMANKSLIKTAQTRKQVPDTTPAQPIKNGDEEKDPSET